MQTAIHSYVRLFVAVALPDHVRAELYRIQKQFKRAEYFEGNYVQPQLLHVTLKFLGNVDSSAVGQVMDSLRSVVSSPFDVTLERVGYFGSREHAHILWVSLVSDQLIKLQAAVDQSVRSLAPVESRPYLGHVTLARIKKVHGNERFKKAVQECKMIHLKFPISQFILMKSELSSVGSQYTPLQVFPLAP